MIGFIPQALDGELFYSLVARWRETTGASSRSANRVWFGNGNRATVGLPSVAHATAQFPPRSGMDAARLISCHTLLPYHSGFLTAPALARIHRIMASGGVTQEIAIKGAKGCGSRALRYCTQCAADDVLLVGLPTWKRDHHLPGNLACALHGLPLREGGPDGWRPALNLLVPPEDGAGRELEDHYPSGTSAAVCTLSRELSGTMRAPTDEATLLRRYRRLVGEAGYVRAGGRIELARLHGDLLGHYGPGVLDMAGLSDNGPGRLGWLSRMSGEQGRSGWHPLQIILLLAMLGRGWQDFEAPLGPEPAMADRVERRRWTGTERAERLLQDHKARIRGRLDRSPAITRGALRAQMGASVEYVERGDPAWLAENLPTSRRGGRDALRTASEDLDGQRIVAEALATELAGSGARPVRINLPFFAKALGVTGTTIAHGRLLPATRALALAALESRLDFRGRQFAWAAARATRSMTWADFRLLATRKSELTAEEVALGKAVLAAI